MNEIKKIVFVNFFHNGDLHLSREFIRKIKRAFPNYSYGYYHKNNPYILQDLQLEFVSDIPIRDEWFGSHIENGVLYLNTWYNSYRARFNNGLTFDTLYKIFDYNCTTILNTSLKDISSNLIDFYPSIDFSFYKTDGIDNNLKNSNRKWFFSNGCALSGQAANFGMSYIINTMADRYPNDLFIFTNVDPMVAKRQNVLYSGDVIGQINGSDLNENSYISERCDIIVGRSSGPFTFAMTQNNMFRSRKLMVTFSSLGSDDNKYWLGDFANTIKYTCKVSNYGEVTEVGAFNKLEKEVELWQTHWAV